MCVVYCCTTAALTLISGGYPYPSTTNDEVLDYLVQGKRLEQPPGCANEMLAPNRFSAHSLTHPLTHLSTHSVTDSSLIHSPTYSPSHPLTYSLTHSPTYSPTHPLTHSLGVPLSTPCSYEIMMKCWRKNPSERPSFSELQKTFADMLLQEVNYMQLTSLTEAPPTNR